LLGSFRDYWLARFPSFPLVIAVTKHHLELLVELNPEDGVVGKIGEQAPEILGIGL
jgi:hypothetical protein